MSFTVAHGLWTIKTWSIDHTDLTKIVLQGQYKMTGFLVM